MQFNDTVTKTGILQDIEESLFGDDGYGSITNDSNRLYQFTNKSNRALDRFCFVAMTADGRWQWDDTNYSTMSIATTNLVANQRDYTFALDHLAIEKVLIKDESGMWKVINPIDQNDQDEGVYLENNNRIGTPTRYDKRGDTLFLDVTPDFSVTGGIKIYFKRGPDYFEYTDTTKVPGIPSIFHGYIPLHVKTAYAIDKTMPQAKNLYELLQEYEKSIKLHYATRQIDDKPRIRIFNQSNK